MTEQLKLCPFCGKEPYFDGVFVTCLNTSCHAITEDILPEYWDRRPIEDALRQRIAVLEEVLRMGVTVVDRAVEIMDSWQVGEWDGVRTFQELAGTALEGGQLPEVHQ